ncbi:MAG: ArnT family glycosyltransferase, partial [bacterium]
MIKKFQPILPVVFVILTFLIRILFILETRILPFSWLSPYVVDSWAYHRWALQIIGGNFWGSEVFFLRPLYPYLLALIYSIFGPRLIAIQVFQALLAASSSFFLYRCTEKIFNPFAAVVAGIGFSLSGVLTFYTGTLLYVEITIFFSLLTLYLITSNHFTKKVPSVIFAGLSFGLLVLCRPEMLLLLPFLLIALWWNKTPVNLLVLFAVVTLFAIAAVPARNFIVARDPVFFTAHSGINFYYGNNPAADGTWQTPVELTTGLGFSHERLKMVSKIVNGKEMTWAQASNYWTKMGLKYIVTHPLNWLKLLVRKLLLFWSNYEIPNNYYLETVRPFSRLLKISFLNFGIAAALGLVGMLLSLRNRRALPVYLFVFGYLCSSLLF